MNNNQTLVSICAKRLKELGLADDSRYIDRLKYEMIEIDVQEKCNYFLEHYKKKSYWLKNERNLLVPYLLGLCPDFSIEEQPDSVMGEYPDIDMDILESVRDYLRNEWAPKEFGKDNVAYIGTYQTYVLKQALIDMARVFGLDRDEIQGITKQFATKDDEGDSLTWEKAQELYPTFKNWCEKYPDAADAAYHLLGRIRNMSQHAGGFIISERPLKGFAPLVKNKKDGSMMTAWPEGQSSQDLMEVGLIKFDFLASEMQKQIVDCIGLVVKRYKLDGICKRGDGPTWSDDSYLEDENALKMADRSDLRFIFQFDSEGIRRLVRNGGVDSFKDLEAYSALYRPGPLNSLMHEAYCDRKKGKEKYEVHPVLKKYLDKTYGVMVYQEQIMQVLHIVGKVPLRDAYSVVKAISKKKIEKFAKYKKMFIENAQVIMGISEEEASKQWEMVQNFAAYGFNQAHSCAYTYQSIRQLWLKAHYPLEFYCSMLNHLRADAIKSKDEKIRDCKRNAESHGVKVNPIDINKSLMKFSIYTEGEPSLDDEIYFGFSNIKHVGESVGSKVVSIREQGGPFTSFKDFLDRFGTDSKVLQSLVSLRAFDDAEPIDLWKYYEFYKNKTKRRQERIKRFETSMKKYQSQFKELTGSDEALSEGVIEGVMGKVTCEETAKKLRRMVGNYRRSITRYEENTKSEDEIISLEEFLQNPVEVSIKDDLFDLLQDREKAEMHFYGFCWTNPLDGCSEAEGYTFEKIKHLEPNREIGHPLEGLVQEVKDKTSKRGNKFRVVKLIDANWESSKIYMWSEEKERFRDAFKEGDIVRLRVVTPTKKFTNFQLLSFPPYLKHKVPSTESDFRVVVLSKNEDKFEVEIDENLVKLEDGENQKTIDILKIAKSNPFEEKEQDVDDEMYKEIYEYCGR